VTDLGKLADATPAARPAPSIDNPKPWTEAKAVIKLKNSKTVTVDAKTVSTYTDCGGDGLHLDYGQKILFKNMQSFSVLDETPTIEFVPLNGEHLTGHVSSDCIIRANNEFGPFEANIRTIERVDFGR
jgi:hypothetical protein